MEIGFDDPAGLSRDLRDVNYHYVYPNGLDLKPGSEYHDKLLGTIMKRARLGVDAMSARYEKFDEVDRLLRLYMPPTKEEEKIKITDPTKPISIVIPASYANLETIMANIATQFMQLPIFKYIGVGPEDTVGTMLMEKVIEYQTVWAGMPTGIYSVIRDALAYGIGAVSPKFVVEEGVISRKSQGALYEAPTVERVMDVIYEGNVLDVISPYSYIPDPNVPAERAHSSDCNGYVDRTTRLKLLESEAASGGEIFNAKYLRHIDSGTSTFYHKRYYDEVNSSTYPRGVFDVTYMFINLVPNDWKLGPEERPQRWLFAVAADKVILMAQPLELDHGLVPLVVCAPECDGYSASPIGRLELMRGMQVQADWYLNSRVTSVRKSLNGCIVYDPLVINQSDMNDPEPGMRIRTRKSLWGKKVGDAIEMLQFPDVTQGHVADAAALLSLMKETSGATDVLQGVRRERGERVSATESRDVRLSALSRLDIKSLLISWQFMRPLSIMLASQTQQFMSREVYIRIAGRWEEELGALYGGGGKPIAVSPLDLAVRYDVLPYDSSAMAGEYASTWVQLLQIVNSSPELMVKIDVTKLFKNIARTLGVRNISDFDRRQSPVGVQPTIMPDEMVAAEQQKGNIIPIQGGEMGGGFGG